MSAIAFVRCEYCRQPQPLAVTLQLHLEECPHHDPATCLVCDREKRKN